MQVRVQKQKQKQKQLGKGSIISKSCQETSHPDMEMDSIEIQKTVESARRRGTTRNRTEK